jgi:hypothetical protein
MTIGLGVSAFKSTSTTTALAGENASCATNIASPKINLRISSPR